MLPSAAPAAPKKSPLWCRGAFLKAYSKGKLWCRGLIGGLASLQLYSMARDGTRQNMSLTSVSALAGSYSYVAVGSSAKTYDDLATPVRRRVLFAGEPDTRLLNTCAWPHIPEQC